MRVLLRGVCCAVAALACAAQAADAPTDLGAGTAVARPDGQGTLAVRPQSARSRYAPDHFSGRAMVRYGLIWGIDSISVRLVESGELVRFTYRVVDPGKARVLNDKQSEAKLDDPKAGVSLTVPTMEKIGQLRQTSAPEAGRSYWMTFSNKGRRVVRGDRVDVVVGQFRANSLVVD